MTPERFAALKESGVYIAPEVDPSRIADDVKIHPGCRVSGSKTSIGPGCELGAEAPLTLENSQLGRSVKLKGGYISGSVFFDGSNIGSCAHIRPGCILEEEAGGAHSVGLKQTVLLPFVTLGSLINFCDVLMAGGTSRKDHSEVGSSFIHFNFTPHQDKATASLIGDVPAGVFLDRKPIFLGGQGGLVGPARIAYGSVVAAGSVCREDILEEAQLLVPENPKPGIRNYQIGVYRKTERLLKNNLIYIGNIIALREWYTQIRVCFVRDDFDRAVLDGGVANLNLILKERIKRLGDLADKFVHSSEWLESNGGSSEEIARQKNFTTAWPKIKNCIEEIALVCPEALHQKLSQSDSESYTNAIQSLDKETRQAGQNWLQLIVGNACKLTTY